MILLVRLAMLLSIVAATGCATISPMPLSTGVSQLQTAEKSVLLAKVTIRNENAPSHQPDLCCIFVEKDGETYSYTKPTLVKEYAEQGKEYLVSVDVAPGKAKINLARFIRQVPMLLMAMADLQFEQEIDVPSDSIVYVGNISAVIKDKETDDDLSAGSLLPLVDQAVAGFSTGTFRVDISDNYEQDIAEFQSRYPFLKEREILKHVLPNWIHPELRQASAQSQ